MTNNRVVLYHKTLDTHFREGKITGKQVHFMLALSSGLSVLLLIR